MRISALVLGSLLAVGCSSAANKKLDEFADRACACADVACSQKVMQDFEAWVKDNKDAKGDEGQAEKAVKKMGECIGKTMKDKPAGMMGKPAGAGDKPADMADKPADTADKPADTADEPAAEEKK
jgi:outer membrane murein-binding lipoprotein Lpp